LRALDSGTRPEQISLVSKMQQIEKDLERLSRPELRKIRDRLDEILEGEMEFTPEFEAQIQQSEREMAAALRPRVRKSHSAE
jgi:hypothetical protein